MKVLVCGGRNYTDRDAVNRELDKLAAEEAIDCIISGGASGADALGEVIDDGFVTGTAHARPPHVSRTLFCLYQAGVLI